MTDTALTTESLDAANAAPAEVEETETSVEGEAQPAAPPTPEELQKAAEEEVAAKAAAEEAAKAEAEAKAVAERQARIDAAIKKSQARMRATQRAQQEAAALRMQLAQERAAREAAIARTRELEAEDPWVAAERRGATPEKLAQQLVQRGTPEEKIALLERRLNETTQAYEKRLEDLARREQQREFETREAEARHFVLSQSRANSDRHELLLARYGSEEGIAAAVRETAKAAYEKSGGRFKYPVEEVLDVLDQQARALIERVAAKAKAKPAGSQESAGKTESKVVEKAAGKAAPSATRTLTQGTASESFTLPANLDQLPEAKQNELLAEYYRRMTSASA